MEELEAGLLTECCDLLNTISTYPENKKCFDCCDNYSPRYLCTTFSTFICSCCANIHQEFGHTIKVLSIFSFTLNEIYVLKETGNRVAADKWLSRWRSDLLMEPDPTSATYKEDARKYMKAKYMEKRWVKLPPPLPGFRDESAESEPRGYDDVSPRKDGVVQPTEATTVSQQHESKSVTQSVLRDTYTAPAPSIMYVPQPMYIPVSMPHMSQMPQMTMAMPGVPQYAYTQYHMPQPDVNQQPSYYGAPLYNYQYESTHCLPPLPPPIMAEGVSWPGALAKPKKKRPITSSMHPVQRELTAPQSLSSSEELPPAPPGAILRSVSDNSIVTTYVLQIPKKEPVNTCDDCNTISNIKISNNEPKASDTKYKTEPNKPDTKSNKSDSKLKLTGIMSKVVGLLSKKS